MILRINFKIGARMPNDDRPARCCVDPAATAPLNAVLETLAAHGSAR